MRKTMNHLTKIKSTNHCIFFANSVTEPNSGRGIEIYTTQPGLQLYTANGLDGGIVGKNGIAYPKYGAFCLETQDWPDAINHVSVMTKIIFQYEALSFNLFFKVLK